MPVSSRMLTFNLDYLAETFTLYMSDSETVEKLKQHVEEKIGVPRKHIKLNGWPINRSTGDAPRFISDRCHLSELRLPLVSNLHVVNMQTIADDMQNAVSHLPGASFALASSVNEPETFELFLKLVHSGDEKLHR